MHVGVARTIVAADATRNAAGFKERLCDACIRPGMARQHHPSRCADICAIEVGTNAMHKVSDHLLGQTRVRTGRADLCTLETRLDALGELRLIKSTQVLRVGLQHLRDTRHCDLPSIADPIPPANEPVTTKESFAVA
jgi:hypothetical protein